MIDVSKSLSDELAACFGDRITISEPDTGMVTIQVPVDEWLEVAQTLHDDPRYQAIVADIQSQMAEQLLQVREWEANDESAPIPEPVE